MEDLKTKLHQAQLNTSDKDLAQLLSEARSRIETLEFQLRDNHRVYGWDKGYGWGKGKDE